MPQVQRVLDPETVGLPAYEAAHGGQAVTAARAVEPIALIETVAVAGLRGRGGAGFPTGTKWRTVASMRGTADTAATVVVNAAEGEPGTLKDRTLLRRNPYRVLEGALIAAHAVGAAEVVVGVKRTDDEVRDRVTTAIAEVREAGWLDGVDVRCAAGVERYLLGEETALLEALEGRPPFPRLAPPFRAGVDDAVTLVNNVETLANVPSIVLDGPERFRALGTQESPGTIVCTVTGRTTRAGVGEFPLGTPLREVIDELGGDVLEPPLVAVLSGTANPILPADALDAPVSWEGLTAAGGGLGSAGFIVIDAAVDVVAVAHGVSRFLSVESCGQCTPCKHDGLAITEVLDRIRRSDPDDDDLDRLSTLLTGITEGARCYLAQQHQDVVQSLLTRFPEALAAHVEGRATEAEPFPVVPLVDIVDDKPLLALDELAVQPDWGGGEADSPSDRIDVRRS
jgi:NADH-quinone oxidoreductase subunit F